MKKKDFLPYTLLFIQPIFMASNLVVARGGVEFVPPISLAFWRWLSVFLLLMLFNYGILYKKKILLKEYKELFFLGLMGCGVCGAFPFIAGQTTTIINMGIIYTSSPIFIILISYFFFKEKMNFFKFIGLLSCLLGVLIIIVRGEYSTLISLKFTKGDLWMLGASIGWALYSIFLFNWKSSLNVFERFTAISFFGALSLLPFYIFILGYICGNFTRNNCFYIVHLHSKISWCYNDRIYFVFIYSLWSILWHIIFWRDFRTFPFIWNISCFPWSLSGKKKGLECLIKKLCSSSAL